ncbi:MAG: sodium/calcium exchanger family protein [uncultured Chloroflexi bacterium]|uniref:Sodium/calcium exchanger family protein n=1 Tax=uncultured Chloroflexota bacterium TaxID=166587 RepID=A0A6J4HM76_9CHLR|nr:MAG: sodium/calcium exchanger family protein [uncultured Chloroflexota bacterium]
MQPPTPINTHATGTTGTTGHEGAEIIAHDPHSSHPGRSGWLLILLAMGIALPWLYVRFTIDFHHDLSPALVALLSGIAILGAAFLLSWAAEAFQMDVSQAFALALLSLIAVLPEYAVDAVFAWRAASDPSQAPLAVANMTGANRLLIGVGWSGVVLLAWWRHRRAMRGRPVGGPEADSGEVTTRGVVLPRSQALELATLGLATLYSFIIPLKHVLGSEIPLFRGIGPIDTVILVSLFALYAWGTARAPAEDPHLVGPAATIGALPTLWRRVTTYGLFIYAAALIFASAEPFAEGLVQTGRTFNIDEFLLVQWLAPFASESPEFIVALLFAWRGLASAGLRTLVASKVNQWTLLIGTLGAVYSIASGGPADLPLDARQTEELFLTSAQSLFALVLISNFDLSVREALILLGTFLAQLFFPQTEVRVAFAFFYVIAAIGLVVWDRSRREAIAQLPAMVREAVGLAPRR